MSKIIVTDKRGVDDRGLRMDQLEPGRLYRVVRADGVVELNEWRLCVADYIGFGKMLVGLNNAKIVNHDKTPPDSMRYIEVPFTELEIIVK
jgi:hypothetical protein